MKFLFIDSNIWLSLYHFTGDDLGQFSKLKDLLDNDIKLLIPTQVRDEVIRNRDAKLKDMLKDFKAFKIRFPVFSKNYDEYESFINDYKDLQRAHKAWVEKIEEDIRQQSLPADTVINDFFNSVELLKCTEEVIHLAELRYKSGNPPGKDDKYGDAINWECLLKYVDSENDLYLVSADKDYASVMSESQLNNYLIQEWRMKKNAQVHFFPTLTSFLNIHISEIQIESEKEKDDLIFKLIYSHSFYETHQLINKLDQFSDWTPIQQENMLMAACNNSQISYIIKDDDVYDFYSRLINDVEDDINYKEDVEKMLKGDEH